MILTAFIVGTMIARVYLSKRGVEPYNVYLIAAVVAVSGLIGSRVFYVLGHFSEFARNWKEVFDLETKGLVFYGGLIFAVPCGYLMVRLRRLPAGLVANAGGLAFLPSMAIARIGCFLNGCCGGKPSSVIWAVRFPGTDQAVHPTQIYELILDICAFFVLLMLVRRFSQGWEVLLCAISLYALVRFFVEFFRLHENPNAPFFFQGLSALLFLGCPLILYLRRRFKPE